MGFVHGDVEDAVTLWKVEQALGGRMASVVLSDMAPKMTGQKVDDHVASVELSRVAVTFAERTLQAGGWYVTRIFAGALADRHREELRARFSKVRIAKPLASRNESGEIYLVCSHFLGGEPPGG